jgi:hypothetical protein
MTTIRADVRIYSGIFLVVLAAIAVIILMHANAPVPPKITNFQQCAAAGYPVMQSYPPECTLPNGRFFVQQVIEQR